ncbi:hypothetical protein EJB05_09828, partial [Eragrostis curvula]
MEMSGENPDRYSYNQLLKGLCKAHRLDKAFAFVSDHMEVGGFCDVVSCNILIDAFCKAKRVTSAVELFKEMGYKGIQADNVTYGTLINGLYTVGYSNLAEELFEKMLKSQIVPNVNLYNIMLHNLCKPGHFKQAQRIFCQMIEKEVLPDIITFNTLIYWLGKISRAIEDLDLFRDMRARGIEPDSLTFRYLISGLLEEGKATMAYEVWEYMMENGIVLDRDVSERLISMLKSKNRRPFKRDKTAFKRAKRRLNGLNGVDGGYLSSENKAHYCAVEDISAEQPALTHGEEVQVDVFQRKKNILLSILEAFVPAIQEATIREIDAGIGLGHNRNQKSIVPKERAPVHLKIGIVKKPIAADSGALDLRDDPSFLKEEAKNDRKSRAGMILRASMENPQEEVLVIDVNMVNGTNKVC